jgi:hypothetical protein
MIFAIVMSVCAIVMFGIGIFQFSREKPVAFYSGEKAPDADSLKDVKAWNRRHGMMWVIYGVFIIIGIIAGFMINNTIAFTIIECICLLVPLVFMVLCHKKLVRDYIVTK